MTTELLKRLFTVKEYDRMVEAGIFAEDDRLELIGGEIVKISPIDRKHAAAVNRLVRVFTKYLNDRVILSPQNPVVVDDYSEPQPDIALLQPRNDFYESEHPRPENILLLVEVADSTIKADREVKIPLYAEDGIAEIWLIDVNEPSLEVYQQPAAKGYQKVAKLQRGQTVSIQAFPEIEILVSEILGE